MNPKNKNNMSFFDRQMFEFLFFLKEFFVMTGMKNKKVEDKLLKLRKKHKVCFTIIDKNGKVIDEVY